MDKDKNLEMIIGTDISQNPHLRPPTKNGGFVYALKTQPKKGKSKRITFNSRSAYVWKKYFNQVMQSSPSIADILPDKAGLELVIGSGCFFPQGKTSKSGRWLKILSVKSGKVLRTLNAPGCLSSSPAVGDIDDDGILEVVATVNGSTAIGGAGAGLIVAWKPNSPEPYWINTPRSRGGNDTYIGSLQSPVIADLDGNGSHEVLAANMREVVLINGRTGATVNDITLSTGETLKSTPFIEDINLDGVPEVIVGGSDNNTGLIYAWTNFHLSPYSENGL